MLKKKKRFRWLCNTCQVIINGDPKSHNSVCPGKKGIIH